MTTLSRRLALLASLLTLVVVGGSPVTTPANAVTSPPTKLLLLVFENHTAAQASAGMPYLSSLASTYGHTTNYHAVTHPSLPNYLALLGGSTFGVADDRGPASHPVHGSSVLDQALARGRTAKVYAESMPANCSLTDSGRYAVRHNPWAYFADATPRANCRRDDVPAGTVSAGALHHDVVNGTLPNVGLVVPDLCHDAHDCSLATANWWLHTWMPAILGGPDYRAGRLAVVVTFDEDDGHAGNLVLTTVVSPRTSHVVATSRYTHYSWTRWADEIVGAPLLRYAASAASLRVPFHD